MFVHVLYNYVVVSALHCSYMGVQKMKWLSCQRAVLGSKEKRTILRGEKVEHYFKCTVMNKAYICEAPTDDGPPNDYIETTVLGLLCKDCPYKDTGRSLE